MGVGVGGIGLRPAQITMTSATQTTLLLKMVPVSIPLLRTPFLRVMRFPKRENRLGSTNRRFCFQCGYPLCFPSPTHPSAPRTSIPNVFLTAFLSKVIQNYKICILTPGRTRNRHLDLTAREVKKLLIVGTTEHLRQLIVF